MEDWIKFSSLVALDMASLVLSILALYFQITVREYKHASNIAAMNLLLVCLLQSLTTIPLFCLRLLGYREGVRDAFLFVYFLFQNATTFSLLILSFDRVASLWKPLQYQAMVNRQIVTRALIFCWILCICLDVIPFVNGWDLYIGHYSPRKSWSLVYHFLTNIGTFFVLLLCWVYIVRVAVLQNSKISNQSKVRLVRLKAIRLTIIILTSYILLYGPACFYYSLKAICVETCFPTNYNDSRTDVELRFTFKFIALLFNLISPLLICWTKQIILFARKSFMRGRRKREGNICSLHTISRAKTF